MKTKITKSAGWMALAALAWLALPGGSAFSKPIEQISEHSVIVTVGKRKITLAELQSRDVHQKRATLYQTLIDLVKERSVKMLAGTRKDFTTDFNLVLSEADVRNFYQSNGLSANGSFEDLAPRIRGFMKQEIRKRKIDEQFQRAQEIGLVKLHIDQPAGFTVVLPLQEPFLRGNPKARVMFAEFTDFQCPFCSRLQPTVKALIKKFSRQVAFATVHFPLNIHPEADEAAIAVECARDQGGFEAYHQILFANQRRQSLPDLKGYARRIKLENPAKFDKCLDSRFYQKRVDRDLQTGLQIEVSGTPAIVIGTVDPSGKVLRGEMVVGAQGRAVLEGLLVKYLKQVKR